jgi:predicted nucleic acid-binding protein
LNALPDTSFLCALYRARADSERAENFMRELRGPLRITRLAEYEFAQGVRFEIFRNRADHTKGFGEVEGLNMLARLDADVERGAIEIVPIDAARVLHRATRISESHTIRMGNRAFDILHVATAMEFGAREFLTFDPAQRALAEAEGLVVPL